MNKSRIVPARASFVRSMLSLPGDARLPVVFAWSLPILAALAFDVSLPLSADAQPAAREERIEAKKAQKAATAQEEAAAVSVLGSQVPPATASVLATNFRSGSQSLFSVLGTEGAARTASGIDIDFVTYKFGPLHISNAKVSFTPSPDGRSCRFEISGTPFGEGSTMEVSGNVEWKAGPQGGDKLDLVFGVGNSPVEAVRAFLPGRIDPSFLGLLSLGGKANGVINEKSTEDAPATPLRGDVEAKLDWQILGRTAPVAITSGFSLDDKMLRVSNGHVRWMDFDAGLKGWFDPYSPGDIDLRLTLKDIDAHKVAVDWNVPPPWQPTATVSGTISLTGQPGKSILRYEAETPVLDVPALAGFNVHMVKPKMRGSLLAINAEVSATFLPESWTVGGITMDSLPSGIMWFRNKVTYNASNSKLWGGDNDITIAWSPEEPLEVTTSGRLVEGDPRRMLKELAPWLGLDVEGTGNASYVLGRDAAGKPRWTAHGSLTVGRIGNYDLFPRVIDALAVAEPAIKTADVAPLLPTPRKGTGTRVDRLYFETERTGDEFAIGGMFLRAGEFQLDADGQLTRGGAFSLDGTMSLPPPVVDKLVAAAPHLAKLRVEGGPMFVPVAITGTPAAPVIALAPGYADLLAAAKRGETVTAPLVKKARQVGEQQLAIIPGAPNYVEE